MLRAPVLPQPASPRPRGGRRRRVPAAGAQRQRRAWRCCLRGPRTVWWSPGSCHSPLAAPCRASMRGGAPSLSPATPARPSPKSRSRRAPLRFVSAPAPAPPLPPPPPPPAGLTATPPLQSAGAHGAGRGAQQLAASAARDGSVAVIDVGRGTLLRSHPLAHLPWPFWPFSVQKPGEVTSLNRKQRTEDKVSLRWDPSRKQNRPQRPAAARPH